MCITERCPEGSVGRNINVVRDTLFCTARLSSERGILVHWPHKTCSDTHLQVSDSYMPLSPQCIHFVEVNEALLTPGTPAIIAKQCKLCGAHLCIAHPGWGGIGTSLIDGQCLPHSPYPIASGSHHKPGCCCCISPGIGASCMALISKSIVSNT